MSSTYYTIVTHTEKQNTVQKKFVHDKVTTTEHYFSTDWLEITSP